MKTPPPPLPSEDALNNTPPEVRKRYEYLHQQAEQNDGRSLGAVRWTAAAGVVIILLVWMFAMVAYAGMPILPVITAEKVLGLFGLGLTIICGIIWVAAATDLWRIQGAAMKAVWGTLVASILATGVGVYRDQFNPKPSIEKWEQSLGESMAKSTPESASKDLLNFIESNKPPVLGRSTSDQFYSDVAIGRILLKNEVTRQVLSQKFGIYAERFLGTGYAAPVNGSYEDAKLREFFVPNHNDQRRGVYRWIFDVNEIDPSQELGSFIANNKPHSDAEGSSPQKDFQTRLKSYSPKGQYMPILIRARLFAPENYRNHFGRDVANRVIFHAWEDVQNLSISDFLRLSNLKLANENKERHLFVWIYFPQYATEVIPATWGNFLVNYSEWMTGIDPNLPVSTSRVPASLVVAPASTSPEPASLPVIPASTSPEPASSTVVP